MCVSLAADAGPSAWRVGRRGAAVRARGSHPWRHLVLARHLVLVRNLAVLPPDGSGGTPSAPEALAETPAGYGERTGAGGGR